MTENKLDRGYCRIQRLEILLGLVRAKLSILRPLIVQYGPDAAVRELDILDEEIRAALKEG